jgi:hypothetical protein
LLLLLLAAEQAPTRLLGIGESITRLLLTEERRLGWSPKRIRILLILLSKRISTKGIGASGLVLLLLWLLSKSGKPSRASILLLRLLSKWSR